MKVILVAVAMRNELEAVLNNYKFWHKKISGVDFFECDNGVVFLLSGVGSINMAYALGVASREYDILKIINYGLAGGCGEDIHKNDIVIAKECMSVGSYKGGKEREYVTFTDGGVDELIIYDSDCVLLDICDEVGVNFKLVRIGSGDIWNSGDVVRKLNDKYMIDVGDMESISVYKLGGRMGVDVISVKVISDNCLLNEGYDRDVLMNKSKDIIKIIGGIRNFYLGDE